MLLCFTLCVNSEDVSSSKLKTVQPFRTNFEKEKAKLLISKSNFKASLDNTDYVFIQVTQATPQEAVKARTLFLDFRNKSSKYFDNTYSWVVTSILATGEIIFSDQKLYKSAEDKFYKEVRKAVSKRSTDKRVPYSSVMKFLEIHLQDCICDESIAHTMFNLHYKVNIDILANVKGTPVYCTKSDTITSMLEKVKKAGVLC